MHHFSSIESFIAIGFSSLNIQHVLTSLVINSISLVNDVFSKDNEGKVPMDKVMILIWLFRDDPSVVQFMAHFVTKVSHESFSNMKFIHW